MTILVGKLLQYEDPRADPQHPHTGLAGEEAHPECQYLLKRQRQGIPGAGCVAGPAELASSGFIRETLPQYIREKVLLEDTWWQLLAHMRVQRCAHAPPMCIPTYTNTHTHMHAHHTHTFCQKFQQNKDLRFLQTKVQTCSVSQIFRWPGIFYFSLSLSLGTGLMLPLSAAQCLCARTPASYHFLPIS